MNRCRQHEEREPFAGRRKSRNRQEREYQDAVRFHQTD
jgi:hypothetical protein